MEKLKVLFEKAKIKYIISVDDCHLENQDVDALSVKENMVAHLEQAILFFNDIANEEISETLSSLDPEDIELYLDSVVSALSQKDLNAYGEKYFSADIETEKTGLVKFFEELKSHNCISEYILLTGREEAVNFFSSIQERLSLSSEARALWMIDNDLHLSNGSTEDGQVLIGIFIGSNCPHNIYALTSAQVGELSNEKFRTELLSSSASSEPLLACVINKHNIIDMQYEKLCNQMAIGFRQNYSGAIKKEFTEFFSEATKDATKKLTTFGEDTLHKVFFESGKAEGVSAIDVFQRLLLIIIKDDITKNISSKYDEISRLISSYTALCEWCGTNDIDKQDYSCIREIRESECYDLYVNEKYSPISYGDIFEIGSFKYILIEQACDLTIRDDGTRESKCATLSKLLKYSEKYAKKMGIYNSLNYYKEHEKWIIDYNDCINIDFDVLDLCSLNSTGVAAFSADFSIEEVSYRYPRTVFSKLSDVVMANREVIKSYNEVYSQFKSKEIDFTKFCDYIRGVYKDNSLIVKITIADGIKYNVQREKRLSADIMDKVIREYSEYHSRKGLNYDFAENYKAIPCAVNYKFPWDQFEISTLEWQSFLPFEHTIYLTGDEKTSKEQFEKSFLEEYKRTVLFDAIGAEDATITWVKKTSSFEVPCKSVPITINECKYCNVFQTNKNDQSVYMIPIDLVPGLKSKRPGSYVDDSGAILKISKKNGTFTFPKETAHMFYNSEILESPVVFSFFVRKGLTLDIQLCDIETKLLDKSLVPTT